MLSGILFICCCIASASACFLSNCDCLDIVSRISFSSVIRPSFSVCPADTRSEPFSVTSALGIGIAEYLLLIYPNNSFDNARAYLLIHCLPTALIFL